MTPTADWRIPLPPATPVEPLPELTKRSLARAWRIHRKNPALDTRTYASGKYRFDAPAGQFPASYVSLDRHAVYAEVFGDSREIPPSAAERRLTEVSASRLLSLVSLDTAPGRAAFELDLRICSTLDYQRTRIWSAAFHRWYPEADGICYLGRHAGEALNVCLYLDRCLPALSAVDQGTLKEDRRHGLVAAHRYRLAPRLFIDV
jgi:hypothetical protein